MRKPSNFGPKGLLKFVKDDISNPPGSNMRYILQICNNSGNYNSEVIAKRWPKVTSEYRTLWREKFGKIPFGEIQIIQVSSDLAVINMIAEDCLSSTIKEDVLKKCFSKAGDEISNYSASAHIKKTNNWIMVESIINDELLKRNINVFIY